MIFYHFISTTKQGEVNMNQQIIIEGLNEQEREHFFRIINRFKSVNEDSMSFKNADEIDRLARELNHLTEKSRKNILSAQQQNIILELLLLDDATKSMPINENHIGLNIREFILANFSGGNREEKILKVQSVLSILQEPEIYDEFGIDFEKTINEPEPDEIPLAFCKGMSMYPGTPMVIGAYSGVGKTTVMNNMVSHYNSKNISQWVYSLEWSGKMVLRGLYKIHRYNKTPDLNQWDVATINKESGFLEYHKILNRNNLTIITNDNRVGKIDVSSIEKHLNIAYSKNQLPKIVYIDYIQRLGNKEALENRYDIRSQTIDTMDRLTQLAKKFKIAFVVLSQTNRQSHSPNDSADGLRIIEAPDTQSLLESSSLEQDASLILTVGRIKCKGEEDDIIQLAIRKNRFYNEDDFYFYINKRSSCISREISRQEIDKINPSKRSKGTKR